MRRGGSGKTTYAPRLEPAGYAPLSIDEEIWHSFGRYGVDYDAACYQVSAYYLVCQSGYDLTCRSRLVDHGMAAPGLGVSDTRSLSR